MIRFKTHHAFLLAGLMAAMPSHAANLCIKVNGGFGSGGSTFVGKGFAVPKAGLCKSWSGYVKTASTVIANSTGSGCMSSDNKVLTLTIISTNQSYLGAGNIAVDHIRICPVASGCPNGAGIGVDSGYFGGPAAKTNCTAALLNLPVTQN